MDTLQGLVRGLPGGLTREALIGGAKSDIIDQRMTEELIVGILEQQPDCQSAIFEMTAFERLTLIKDISIVGQQQSAQLFKQGGLSGPVLTDQGDAVAWGNLKVDRF
jgi:hypothetical protein